MLEGIPDEGNDLGCEWARSSIVSAGHWPPHARSRGWAVNLSAESVGKIQIPDRSRRHNLGITERRRRGGGDGHAPTQAKATCGELLPRADSRLDHIVMDLVPVTGTVRAKKG